MVDGYPYAAPFPTRWNDNDVYGHVNNAVYYEAMDTTINTWLIRVGGLDVHGGPAIGVCASSSCDYLRSAEYPAALVVGLRAGRVGRTSVTWETGIALEGEDGVVASGRFVHVFVDRATRRPVPVPEPLRSRIEADLVL